MNISVICRHGVRDRPLKAWVYDQCLKLATSVADASRVRVVFDRISDLNKPGSLIQCHLSLRAPKKQHIDIYEEQKTADDAFEHAYDRLVDALERGQKDVDDRGLYADVDFAQMGFADFDDAEVDAFVPAG